MACTILINILGNEQLVVEAEKLSPLLCNSDHQRRMSELKSMIVQSNAISLDQVDTECEKAAARAATCKLKERMELVYLTAQRRHANIQKLSSMFVIPNRCECALMLCYCTATSKQRAKLRKAISNDHKKLKSLVKLIIVDRDLLAPLLVLKEGVGRGREMVNLR